MDDSFFGAIEKLLNLGVPLAMLVVIVWLIVKYAPAAIKALQSLGNSIAKNTDAVTELKVSYDFQIDRLSVVTTQLKTLNETLDYVEKQQVKTADYDKLCTLINDVQTKLVNLTDMMENHCNDYETHRN